MSLPGRRRGWFIRLCLVLVSVVTVGLVGGGDATAAPRPTVEQVRRQVDDLHDQVEAATEKYDAAREVLASLNVRLTAAQAKLIEQRTAVDQARNALGLIAADTYRAGDLATLSLFLGDDPDKYVDANGLLVSLGDRRARAVSDLVQQRRQLMASLTDVQDQQQRLQQIQHELQGVKAEIQQKLAEATALLARLTGEQRGQLTRTVSAGYRASLADLGVTVPGSGSPRCSDVPIGPLDARVSKVIAYACAHLGDPYHWAGDGPSSFDCSGLTLMAWKQAGVSLPHNAAMQATFGTTVGADQLRPGDLVFFRSPVGHVGIYLGSGVMIHAPRSGDVVKIAPMRTGEFATAVRL